jgi:hypothetical protein
MGCRSVGDFEAARREHAGQVRKIFDRRLKSEGTLPPPDSFPPEFA